MTGQTACDSQRSPADLDALHVAMGVTVRALWDVQNSHTATTNRIAMAKRDYPNIPRTDLEAVADQLSAIENGLELQVKRMVRQHPMRLWVDGAPGIGYGGFARIIAITGSLHRFPTVSKLWKYLGLHVTDGHAPRKEKGLPWTHTNCQGGHLRTCEKTCKTDHHALCTPDGFGTAYSAQGRVVCHQLAESIVKVGRGPYREAYDTKKAYYEAERPDWTQARRHNAAMRYAVKCLIRDMWVEWRRDASDTQEWRASLDPQEAAA